MTVLYLFTMAVLLKLNYDDLLSKTCKIFDLLILASLIMLLKSADFSYPEIYPEVLLHKIVLTYSLPVLMATCYYCITFVRANLGAGDIMFLFAVAPLVPGVKVLQLLFLASVLAIPVALLKHLKQNVRFEINTLNYSFPFIPYLTFATIFIAC